MSEGDPMGVVEHLKTLCCLGLPPESAMVAVTPLLHEIIPHGWTRIWLIEPDATISSTYGENPSAAAHFRRCLWTFAKDPASPVSLILGPALRAVGIGWGLHLQGRGYLESSYYREMEAPLDSCWVLDAMVGDGGRSIAGLHLTRPRSAHPFQVDDVQRLDRLRPWLAHALRRSAANHARSKDEEPFSKAGASARSGEMILTSDGRIAFQTNGLEFLLKVFEGKFGDFTHHIPDRHDLPLPILKLLRQITGAANGTSNTPPSMQVSTAYGVLTLEAKWLVPAGTLAEDAARDPKSCLIAVTIELHEHPIAHAARALRDYGATPAQTKVGVQLAFGKSKPVIADELGVQLSSVESLTKKLYQTLDVHNSTELATQIWLGQIQAEARQNLRRAG
jgi:DNA-binding CsgD family transcriptional regulator